MRNFEEYETEFIAFGEALDANTHVVGATNCEWGDCWRIGRNFPYYTSDDVIIDNKTFVPHLESIGLTGYIFFQRWDDGRVVLPDYAGGRTGDFSLTQYYVYWPDPVGPRIGCEDYVPPTEDFYECFLSLGHGWFLEKIGLNDVKLSKCVTEMTDCQMAGGTQKTCKPAECSELIPDW